MPIDAEMATTAEELNERWAHVSASAIIREARFNVFNTGLVMSSHFNRESALLIDIAILVEPRIPIVYLEDSETRAFADWLTKRWNLNVKRYPLGPDGKLATLRNALTSLGATAVLHGIRAYQNEMRAQKNLVELGTDGFYRINPLLNWSREEVEDYFAAHHLPYNEAVPPEGEKAECGIHCYARA